ncbi:MAG: CinA family protein [Wenzhouxiangella sp.]|jgi:nicotinamide-nucleotide amidase|nr:CinA family protein [Wenzhouxiangella sp.]MDR9453297.1 CinA family protein [Wenzhouxiangella sp.]
MRTPNDEALNTLAAAVAHWLKTHGRRLSVAESCTGGWVAKSLTDLAGSSQWFEQGFVTYSNEAKSATLAVPPSVIEANGAVSEAVACDMAQGAQQRAGSDFAVSITGIAGPGGGSPDKPVGTVCFGWALPNGVVETERHHFEGDRDAVRRASVAQALEGLLDRFAGPLSF